MKLVTFLGTPLQFVAIVGGLVFHDGMGDPINLPPCLDDLRVISGPNPTHQVITLHRNWRDDDGIWHYSTWTVTAVGKGQDKSTLEISDNGPNWERIADGWDWLVSELAARGRIEGGGAGVIVPSGKKKGTRGTSKETDAKAREAKRLYHENGMTQEKIAERSDVAVRTVKRWLKRST